MQPASEVLAQSLKNIKGDLNSLDEFTCPDCQGIFLIRARHASGVCGKCAEAISKRLDTTTKLREEVSKMLGGDKIFEKTSWSNIQTTPLNQKAVEACQVFDSETDNLFLWGECGRGKTLLAKAVARDKALKGLKVVIETTSTLSRKTRGLEGKEEQKMVDRFCEADIFILDDLGRGNVTPTMLSILCEVLDRRFDNNKQGFIATSNLDFTNLAVAMGDDRLTSRLLVCRCIQVKGDDMRLK